MIGIDDDVYQWLMALRADDLDAWPYEIIAWSRFVKRAKAHGYWNKLFEVYPLSGKTHECCKYKMKIATGLNRIMTVGGAASSEFTAEKYSPRMGLRNDAPTGFLLQTGFFANAHYASQNDGMISIAIHGIFGNNGTDDFNCFGSNGTHGFSFTLAFDDVRGQLHAAGDAIRNGQDGGHWILNRESDSANVRFYRNGAFDVSNAEAATGLDDNEVVIGGRVAFQEAPAHNLAIMIGEGFTDADCLQHGADVKQLLNDLHRAVDHV